MRTSDADPARDPVRARRTSPCELRPLPPLSALLDPSLKAGYRVRALSGRIFPSIQVRTGI